MPVIFHALSLLLGLLAAFFALVVWRGYALSVLWGWFMAPAFGLPLLSIPMAIGIGVLFWLFSASGKPSAQVEDAEKAIVDDLDDQEEAEVDQADAWNEKKRGVLKGLARGFMYPAVGLAVGWIVKLFV